MGRYIDTTSEGGHEWPLVVCTFFAFAFFVCVAALGSTGLVDRMAYVPGDGSCKLSARGSAFRV